MHFRFKLVTHIFLNFLTKENTTCKTASISVFEKILCTQDINKLYYYNYRTNRNNFQRTKLKILLTPSWICSISTSQLPARGYQPVPSFLQWNRASELLKTWHRKTVLQRTGLRRMAWPRKTVLQRSGLRRMACPWKIVLQRTELRRMAWPRKTVLQRSGLRQIA